MQRDINIPVRIGARDYCAAVRCTMQISDISEDGPWHPCNGRLEPIPMARFSVFADGGHEGGYADFQKTQVMVPDPAAPGGQRAETVGSLADIRRIERESAARERNGEGGAMVFRDYSQDRSNRDTHTLGKSPALTAPKHYSNGTKVTIRRGDAVTDAHGVPAEFQQD